MIGLVSYLGAFGLPLLVAVYGEDRLHLTTTGAGAVLIGFGLTGLFLGAVWGTASERYGPRLSGAAAFVLAAITVAAVGSTGSVAALAAWWVAAGATIAVMTVALQNLTVRAVPGNRGGALSAVSALRFTSAAIAPVAWLPVYHADARPVFALAAVQPAARRARLRPPSPARWHACSPDGESGRQIVKPRLGPSPTGPASPARRR